MKITDQQFEDHNKKNSDSQHELNWRKFVTWTRVLLTISTPQRISLVKSNPRRILKPI